MAQSVKSKSRTGSKSSSRKSSKAKSPKSKSSSARSRSTAKARPKAKAVAAVKELPSDVADNAAQVGNAALDGTRAAGRTVGRAAVRARVPLAAGAGLAAGAVGGVALARLRNGHHRSLPIDVDQIVSAAKRVGSVGEEIGRMASVVERAAADSKK